MGCPVHPCLCGVRYKLLISSYLKISPAVPELQGKTITF